MALPKLQGVETGGYTPLNNQGISAGDYGAIASGVTAVASAYAQSKQYEIQAIQRKINAKIAKLQGEEDSLALLQNFNKAQASNAVIAAAQGRSGATVQAIGSAAESQLNWDIDYTKMSSEIQAQGYSAEAKQLESAAKTSLIGGTLSAIGKTSSDIAYNRYSIGGKKNGA